MNIIILNGPSGSGKTTIGKCLQEIMDDHYVMLGLDQIIYTMPDKTNDYKADLLPRVGFGWLSDTDQNGHPLMHLTPGTYGKKIYSMLKTQVKCFADSGFNVIVDHVSLIDDYKDWCSILVDHEVVFCGITADQEILDQREKQRGDRVIGGSRAQMIKVHNGFKYDIFIDTSAIDPLEAAKKIYELVYCGVS